MQNNSQHTSRFKYGYLFTLPFFFLLHILNEQYLPSLLPDFLILTLAFSLIAAATAGIMWLILRDWPKATLAALAMLAFNLFFGSAHDFLKTAFPGSFFIRYSFILPAVTVFFVAFIICLKRTNRPLLRLRRYLNLLFILLVAIEIGLLLPKLFRNHQIQVANLSDQFNACDTCQKPDIYLLVADEYAGNAALQDLFKFDNSKFLHALQERGFHVSLNSHSNYNATVYSMASLFSMDYLSGLQTGLVNHRDIFRCRSLIRHNNLTAFFGKLGYNFSNYTFFDFAGTEKLVHYPFFINGNALFIAQTFPHRIRKDIGFNFLSRARLEKIVKNTLYNNRRIEKAFRQEVKGGHESPKFVYTHLAMPHQPYFFDSSGKEAPIEILTEHYEKDWDAYVGYLHYTNRKLLEFIDMIQSKSSKPPVILLISDHGFRQEDDSVDRKYYFANLSAVYLPGGHYAGFTDHTSNVNLFRLVLNNQFGQNLPLLKDSTSFIKEP